MEVLIFPRFFVLCYNHLIILKIMVIDKNSFYLNVIQWGIFLIIIIAPFLFIQTFLYPTIFPQGIFFRTVIEIILIFYVLLALKEKKYRPRLSPIFLGLLIFFSSLIITSLLGVNFSRSFWGTSNRMEGLIGLIHFFVFFIILTSVFNKKDVWLKLFKLSLFTSLAVSLTTILLTILFYAKILKELPKLLNIPLGNPAFLGFYTLLNIFLSLLIFFEEKNNKYRIFYLVILLFNFAAMIISGARTAIGASILGLFSFFIFYIISSSIPKQKKIFIIVTIIFLIFSFLIFFFVVKNKVKDEPWVQRSPFVSKIFHTSMKSPSLLNRFIVWKISIDGWKEKKLFGWGSENFNIVFAKYFNPEILSYEISVFDRPHNKFLEVLALNGTLGMLAYIFFFATIFYTLFKTIKEKTINFLAGGVLFSFLVAYLFQLFFLFDTLHSYVLFFLVISFINIKNEKKIIKRPKTTKKKKAYFNVSILKSLTLILCFIAIAFFWYKTNFLPTVSQYYAGKAATIQNYFKKKSSQSSSFEMPEEDYLEIFELYKKSINFAGPSGIKELRYKLAEFTLNATNNELTEKKTEVLVYTSKELLKSIDKKPDIFDYTIYLSIGKINNLLGMQDKKYLEDGEVYFKKAIEINPSQPETYLYLARNKFLQGDSKEMSVYYEKAATLNKNIPQPYWNIAWFYYQMNEKDKALTEAGKAMIVERQLIESRKDENYAPNISNLVLLFLIYSERKDYQNLISIYEEAIGFYEKNATQTTNNQTRLDYIGLYKSLAATYFENGQKEKAKETALNILKLDPNILEVEPDIKNEVEGFIIKINE